MSQDPFGPHDDVGGVLFSFLPDLSDDFFLYRTVSDHFRIQAVEPSPTIPFFFLSSSSFSDEDSSSICSCVFKLGEDHLSLGIDGGGGGGGGSLTPTSGSWTFANTYEVGLIVGMWRVV